jgi:hypothetical protein
MKSSIKVILFALVLLAASGCAGRDDAKSFLPLEPGNKWTYAVNIEGKDVELFVEVGQPREVEGKTAFPLSYSYSNLGLPTQIEYYVVQEDAIIFPRIDNVQGQYLKKPFQVFLKFPLKEGSKWEWSGNLVPEAAGEETTKASVNAEVREVETVVTPIKTYKKALRISFESSFDTAEADFVVREDRWYVKGVGMVKEVLYDDAGEELLSAVLKNFKK